MFPQEVDSFCNMEGHLFKNDKYLYLNISDEKAEYAFLDKSLSSLH